MSEEEFFDRAINRICKDYDYDFATEFKNIYLKKDKELQQKENIIKEVREYLQGTINRWEDYEQFYEVVVEDKYILEILDKGE